MTSNTDQFQTASNPVGCLAEILNQWQADSSELFASIQRQTDFAGQNRVTNETIASRAVEGFLNQPSQYWVAPLLQDAFANPKSRDGKFVSTASPYEIILAYTELRLRTIAHLKGNSQLNHIDSECLQDAISFEIDGIADRIENTLLRTAIQEFDADFNSPLFDEHRKSGAALRALVYITDNYDLHHFTRKCGRQIIEGAKLICPSLLNDTTPTLDAQPQHNLG